MRRPTLRLVSATIAPDETKSDETKSDETKAAEKPADSATPPADAPAAETPAEKPAETAAESSEPAEKSADEAPAATKPAEPKYEPLEKVQDQIRDSIAGQKAGEKIGEIFDELSAQMRRYADEIDIYNASKESDPKLQRPKPFPFAELAKANGVEAKELPLVSAVEVAGEDIGKVHRIIRDPRSQFGFRTEPFVEFAFSDSLPTYKANVVEDTEGNAYLFWKNRGRGVVRAHARPGARQGAGGVEDDRSPTAWPASAPTSWPCKPARPKSRSRKSLPTNRA